MTSMDLNENKEVVSSSEKLKAENEKNLSQFSAYWINPTSLQNKLVKLDQNLWNFWAEKNWVDGDLWKLSIKAISNIQEKLNLPVTWVVNFLLITMLFPKTFRTFNKNNNWRTVEESIKYVREQVLWEKKKVKDTTGNRTRKLVAEVSDNSNWIWRMFNSVDSETIWDMTYCSRTACKNLYEFWLKWRDVPRGESAIASMNLYKDENYMDKLTNLPVWTNVLDLFIDSSSKFEHRAAAYLNRWEWFVLDPYTRMGRVEKDLNNPIPMNKYVSSKKIMWAFPHTV